MTATAARAAALDPVRSALTQQARAAAQATLDRARSDAAALTEQARQAAAELTEQARRDGAAQAEPVAMAELARARRAARSAGLTAERARYDEVAAQIRTAVLGLAGRPDYPALRDRLATLARQTAGQDAVISEHPLGGVIARTPAVLADCSLPRLADRVIAALDARISEVCRP